MCNKGESNLLLVRVSFVNIIYPLILGEHLVTKKKTAVQKIHGNKLLLAHKEIEIGLSYNVQAHF